MLRRQRVIERLANAVTRCASTLCVALAASSGGCVLGPDYHPPAVPLENEWIYHGSTLIDSTQAVAPLWWESAFADPNLDELVALSLQQNLTLRAASLRMIQAQQQLAIACGNQYPQLQQMTGSASRTKESDLIVEDYRIGFNLSWELDMWGRFRREVESAAAELGASIAEYDGAMVSLVAQVAQTYILIRTTEARLEVARRNIDLQEQSLHISRAKFEAGEVSALDAAQAETLLNNTKASVPDLEITLQQLKNILAVLLGMPPRAPGNFLGGTGKIPVTPATVAVGMPQDLLRQRPDVRAAERALAAQAALIGVAQADLYPAFSIGGAIGSRATEAGDLFEGPSETWDLFGAFQWNLFNYGRLRSNVRLQDARFQELLELYRQTVLEAQLDVENAIVAYLKTHEQLELLRRSARASSESVRLSTAQYTNGLIGFNTVITTLTADAQQQDLLTQAEGFVALNLVQVFQALGGGWELRDNLPPVDLVPAPAKEEMLERNKYWRKTLE